ncbi:pyrroloquinoline quinone biosynthesis protein PqqB [Actinomadura sp. KC216]|uniref:pyrroloquinoline quinone biosynthesis protein PqqB n=1 Tax=Actinomadura sp. KC216 TaxID=2530370 RepID=UPI00104B05E4|nr:pyrroloquinoline quinone biosynthesis protein PqqB [Actinomadura sp. KC216]TDB78907.1 pyrroloquinoline quinone biosynthesis protein PqqB [Actinomadura sp. KC216]
MRLLILGTAAGGGVPQWNCACAGCAAARTEPSLRRRHASIAVEAGEGSWYVVNATPDIGEQIEACAALHPGPARRATPVAGVILTDAELDHTLGIPRLREASALRIVSTGAVRAALSGGLRLDRVLAPYAGLSWTLLPEKGPEELDGGPLEVQGIRVSGKRPRYARELDEPAGDAWVVALRVRDLRDGKTVVYAPALADWPDALDRALQDADCVFVDGTFWDDEEPVRSGFTAKTSTQMGHLPITGPNGTAERLAALPAGRRFYTHLNNTNRLVHADDPGHRRLAEAGLEVAREGALIEL